MTARSRRVPDREHPDATPQNIPVDILKEAIAIAIEYRECPHCGERQFLSTISGRNTTAECKACQQEMRV